MDDESNPRLPPAANFHPGEYLVDEMRWRGWHMGDVVLHGGGSPTDGLALLVFLSAQDRNCRLDAPAIKLIAQAFDVSEGLFTNLQAAWLANPVEPDKFDVPDELFGPYGQLSSTAPSPRSNEPLEAGKPPFNFPGEK